MSKKIGYEEKRKAMLRLCNVNPVPIRDIGNFFVSEHNGETYDVFGSLYIGIAWKRCSFEYGGSSEFIKG